MTETTIYTRNGIIGQYVMEYEYETCFDDGGIGHDSGWSKAQVVLSGNFRSDKAAKRAAQAQIDAHKPVPCNGSFCDNKGRQRMRRVFFRPIPLPDFAIWPLLEEEEGAPAAIVRKAKYSPARKLLRDQS